MTVKELIEQLQKEDQDRVVIMAKDSEGNGYSPLSSFWTGAYKAEASWSGYVGAESMDDFTEEDLAEGYGEEDVIEDGEPALILTPVN